jgi:hypothetical protein
VSFAVIAIVAAVAVAAAPTTVVAVTSASVLPTVNGHPNLEGVWTYGTATPFERPDAFAGRRFMTDDEAAAYARQAAADRRAVVASRFGIMEVGDTDRPYMLENGRKVTSIISDPPDGRMPALTREAQQRLDGLDFDRLERSQDMPLSERCVRSLSGPPMFPDVQFPNVQIAQTNEQIVFALEDLHDTRIIPFSNRNARSTIRSWVGNSQATWSGNTLIIDTVNFKDQFEQRRKNNRFDRNLHLIERITPIEANVLRYQFTIDDPTMFERQWSGSFTMRRTDMPLFEIACHEGNYSMANILRGARLAEHASVPDR